MIQSIGLRHSIGIVGFLHTGHIGGRSEAHLLRRRDHGWRQMTDGCRCCWTQTPWKRLGCERTGEFGVPGVACGAVRVVVSRVQCAVKRLHETVELGAETVLQRLEIAFFLTPFRASVFEPHLTTQSNMHRPMQSSSSSRQILIVLGIQHFNSRFEHFW